MESGVRGGERLVQGLLALTLAVVLTGCGGDAKQNGGGARRGTLIASARVHLQTLTPRPQVRRPPRKRGRAMPAGAARPVGPGLDGNANPRRERYLSLKLAANRGRVPRGVLPAGATAQRDPAAKKAQNSRGAPARAFAGIGFDPSDSFMPPDPVCAMGAEFILEAVNDNFTVLDLRGRIVLSLPSGARSVDFNDFFGQIPGTEDVAWFDPRVLYDAATNRFWMACVGGDFAENDESWLGLAVSAGPDPRGNWTVLGSRLDFDGANQTARWGDFPDIGLQGDFVVAATNQFDFAPPYNFGYAKVRVFSKAQILAGAITNFSDFTGLLEQDGSQADTLRVAKHRGVNSSLYLVNCKYDAGSTLEVWRVGGTSTAPSLSSSTIAGLTPYAIPPSARQPAARTAEELDVIDTGDARILTAIADSDRLWAAHHTAYQWPGSEVMEAAIHWLEVDLATNTLVQQGIFGGKGFDYYYPCLDTSAGTRPGLAMVFTRSGPREFPGARTTRRNTRTPAGTLASSVLLRAGNGNYLPSLFSGEFIRWGDYLGADRDPAKPGRVLMLGQFSNSSVQRDGRAWGTTFGFVTP